MATDWKVGKTPKEIALFHVNMEASALNLAERDTDNFYFALGELSAVKHLARNLGCTDQEIEEAIDKAMK